MDDRAIDWQWLRSQCIHGHILNKLKPIAGKTRGIIVPVFDEARCFFDTAVEPFKGRNERAADDEVALQDLLKAATQLKIPVYLGMGVLSWERSNVSGKEHPPSVFTEYPSWQEVSYTGKARYLDVSYASPFNQSVRDSLAQLGSEIGRKFPLASGIVVNLRLGSHEILGFSEAARTASIKDIATDPIDLDNRDVAEDKEKRTSLQWIEWRLDHMTSLLQSIATAYKKPDTRKQVFCLGAADYYELERANGLKSGQDWRRWIRSGTVDGVFLEGHWSTRNNDDRYLQDFYDEFLPPSAPAASTVLVPASHGNHLISNTNFLRDWLILGKRVPQLEGTTFIVSGDRDIEELVAVTEGKTDAVRTPEAKLQQAAPVFLLADQQGRNWDSADLLGKGGVVLLAIGNAPPDVTQQAITQLQEAGPSLIAQDIQPFIVSQAAVRKPGEMKNLVDDTREVLSAFSAPLSLVGIDRAGFLRGVLPIDKPEEIGGTLKKWGDLNPVLAEGKPAPDFAVSDMNGRTIRLSELRGKKNIVLTFFPRCFTGGCASHLASLNSMAADFAASDTEVWAVSVDSSEVQRAFAESLKLKFTLIPDTDRNLCFLYSAVRERTDLAARQTVLIDKTGIVRKIDREVRVGTHGPDVQLALRKLGMVP